MSSSYEIFSTIQRQRVSDGQIVPILSDCADYKRLLILVWPQLGDFDSLEYAWWLEKEAALWQKSISRKRFSLRNSLRNPFSLRDRIPTSGFLF